jgi:hypothetical protein
VDRSGERKIQIMRESKNPIKSKYCDSEGIIEPTLNVTVLILGGEKKMREGK